jgi:glycosyltransferase involved in cell wall biosynthesis
MTNPQLSIIIPMREGVEDSWLQELLKIQGSTEFILVYPPHVSFFKVNDPRLRQIKSPLKGEVIQRITALLNALGKYVLSINCDEYIHPQILEITEDYFKNFPDSYFFRLNQEGFPFGKAPIDKPWNSLPKIQDITVRNRENSKNFSSEEIPYMLREIPIAPVNNKLDFLAIFRGRKDQHGPHHENFDKKVWKNELVQEALKGLVSSFTLFGPFKYVPFWTSDRLMGLCVQAKFFNPDQPDQVVGHWLPLPEQLRTENNPPNHPRKNRRYILAEILLLKNFPKFGYIWNLTIFDKGGIFMVWFPKDTLKEIAQKLGLKKSNVAD